MHQKGHYQNFDSNRNTCVQQYDLNKSGYVNNDDLNKSGIFHYPDVNAGCNNDVNKSFMSTNDCVRQPFTSNQFNINQTSPRRANTNFLTGGLMKSNEYENINSFSHSRQVQPQETRKLKRSETINYGRSNDPPIKSLRELRPFMNYTLACGEKSILHKPDHEKTHPYAFRNTDLYTNDKEDLEYWVTVYGYEKKLTQMVLTTFSSYGEIIAKKISNSSNYMHLKYSDKLIARSVRNRNGTMLHNCMIGVKGATDLKLVDDDYIIPTIGSENRRDVKYEPLKDADVDMDSDKFNKNFVSLVPYDSAHYSSDLRLTNQQISHTPPLNEYRLKLISAIVLLILALFTGYLIKIF